MFVTGLFVLMMAYCGIRGVATRRRDTGAAFGIAAVIALVMIPITAAVAPATQVSANPDAEILAMMVSGVLFGELFGRLIRSTGPIAKLGPGRESASPTV